MGEWAQKTLGDLITLQRGFDITKAAQSDGSYPVVSSSGVTSFHNQFMAEGPGVVIGRKGTLGTAFYIPENYWPHDTTLWVKNFKGNDEKFIYYLLKILPLEKLDSGSANPTLNRNYAHLLNVAAPSPAEQERVAAVLSALDAKIDLNLRINAELEALAKTIYDYWFVQFDFPDTKGRPHKSSGGKMVLNEALKREIPEGWGGDDISSIADVLGGATPSKARPDYWSGNIPFFTPTDAAGDVFQLRTEESITQAGLDSCSSDLFAKGTVFITARGSVGKIAIAGRPMAMNQSCYALAPKVATNYPYVFLHAKTLIHHLKIKASGSTFNSIVTNDIGWTKLISPSPEVISAFCKIVVPMFERIEAAQHENKELTQLRDWLLPLLMNGQVTPSAS